MAPETLLHQRYGFAVDWWSLGALAYDMMTGQPPFSSNNRKKTIDMICSGKLKLPSYLTNEAKDLLKKLMRKTPSARLGATSGAREVKAHPFFKGTDWAALLTRSTEAPVVPNLAHDGDVSCFDAKFTSMPVVDSPVEGAMAPLSASIKDVFKGFSYVAPALLEEMHRSGRI